MREQPRAKLDVPSVIVIAHMSPWFDSEGSEERHIGLFANAVSGDPDGLIFSRLAYVSIQ
ncbi:hypothetical protein PPUJ13061_55900 [Pseudomonas putida]|nr:hypothetical protein PPUJ13061_55900 [Pseudomonas putida]